MGPIPLQARQRAINTLRQDEQKSASRKQRGYSSSGTAFTVPGKRSEVKPFVIPSTVRNPYAQKYSQFSGEGQDPRKVKHFKIWFPFLNQNPLPLDIKVIASARVSDMIGYILYRFNEETALRGTSLDVSVPCFCICLAAEISHTLYACVRMCACAWACARARVRVRVCVRGCLLPSVPRPCLLSVTHDRGLTPVTSQSVVGVSV